uniref:mRNA (guanine-N(7))-methyltransferase n=1 Tax=Brassica oleracea var. oleracea TaxID=109376 RepID=A0A0D2ZQI4_BRAOL
MLSLNNSDKLKVWRLLIVYTGFVLVNGFLKRNSNLAAPLVSNTSFTLRMLLIALNGLSFNIFKSLAEEYDLELVFVKNSHEVVHEYMKNTEFVELMRRLGALGDGNQDQSTLSADECDAAYLYLSFVLRKRGGESDGGQRRGGRRKNGKMNLSKDNVLYIDNKSVKECNFTQLRVS